MASSNSNIFSITLTDAWTPSYSLPSSGQAVAIQNSNTLFDTTPSILTDGQWEYALLKAYSAGTFVSDYSAGGAYVFAGTGGHNVHPNLGAVVFDFADASWTRIDNANGIAQQVDDFTPGELSDGEIIGATAGQIPSPCHTYSLPQPISTANGGGSKGGVILPIRPGTSTIPGTYTRAMRFDLSTRLWTRFSTNKADDVAPGEFADNCGACYDPTLNRIWSLPQQIHGATVLPYLPIDSPTWNTISYGNQADRGQNRNPFVYDAARIMVTGTALGGLRGIDLTNPTSGWVDLDVDGTLPHHNFSWAYYPPNGKWYTREMTGSVYQLTAPPTNPLTNQWSVTTVSFSGATLADAYDSSGNGAAHYTRFFYVPSIQCLAWIAMAADNVVLMRP